MPINTIIVDDEKPARDELAYLLKGFPEINVIGQGKNGVEAVSLIKEHAPDLVFLDVQMPGLDGFGVLKKLVERKIKAPHVVFATAFDHYAVQAFDVNAVDYVLKPFDKARISKAIARARKMLESQTSPADRLEQLVQQLGAATQSSSQPVKLLVKSRRQFELSHARGIERRARFRIFLAAAPLVPGEHSPHQGSRSLVQVQLHAEDERQKTNRNPRQPRANQTAARTLQVVMPFFIS
jgi:two-component system LytT family response regulator/two-component system response regulator LytT